MWIHRQGTEIFNTAKARYSFFYNYLFSSLLKVKLWIFYPLTLWAAFDLSLFMFFYSFIFPFFLAS